ncbi:MAG: alpha-amylase family protein [Kineosporiaceae bacterium]
MSIRPAALAPLAEQALRHVEIEPEAFAERLERWGEDLLTGLSVFAAPPAEKVLELVVEAHNRRRPALRALDRRRTLRPDWFALPEQVGYVCYPDRFAGTLNGVRDRIGYLRELGVTYLHLMPLLDPRPGPDDGGYAVQDYRRVRADLGTMEDLEKLSDDLHEAGIALTLDLVLNHVAREHEWARAAVRGERPYRDYFMFFRDRTMPDLYERTLPEVFPDFAPGSFTWCEEVVNDDGSIGAWVWTTFNDFQWDLDWSNPAVFCELLDVILFLANVGVDCLRLDAIAFLWKRMGTNCQNQPEVHDIVQALRAAVRIAAPGVIFKAEAIVAPEDLPAYLGTGRHSGRVCDLAYHNSLMVQLWSSLATGSADLARRALAVPPPKPVTTAWTTYVRCHDDIGWAISDSDAAAVGLSGHAHRAFLAAWYDGDFTGSFARGEPFQVNPDTGDVRTSGTLASLAGLEAALERQARTGDTHLVDLALGRIFLLHAVVYGYGGIPLLYMGDELGLLNDRSYLTEERLASDNRWLHRPRMPWDVADQRHTEGSLAARVFAGLAHLGRLRARLDALHAAVESEPVDVGVPGLLALRRRHPAGALLQIYNVTARWQHLPADAVTRAGLGAVWEHISGFAPQSEPMDQGWIYALPPYAAWWLSRDDG